MADLTCEINIEISTITILRSMIGRYSGGKM